MQEEQKHLQYVINEFDKLIEENRLKQNVVHKNYVGDTDAMVQILNKLENIEKSLKVNAKKPYFARIDFLPDDSDKISECYIGKIGTINDHNEIVTVDWRAPIASLYYDHNTGSCSYDAPDGEITGNLLLKRQYEIEDGKLLNYHNVDTVTSDELLNSCLNSSVDARLKNIVSTIQKEQNEIIRRPIEHDMIVQGVAGSGKTTVALHRIAYLVYQNRKRIDVNQYMIIGPNKFFVNYISNVLPDLDVNGVPEYDLLEFTSSFLNENVKLEKSKDTELTKYKLSMEYQKQLEEYVDKLNDKIVPESDLQMFDFSIVDRKQVLKIYKEVSNETYFFTDRVERTTMFLQEYINSNCDSILVRANEYMAELFDKTEDNEMLKNISNMRDKLCKEIKDGCSHILKKYFRIINDKVTSVYKKALLDIFGENSKLLNYDDLVGLLYFKYRISGNYNYRKYMHVVIDEAQDYGNFFFYMMKKIMAHASFSIFGDLAQTIHKYRTIESWDNVVNVGFQNNIQYLTKSYRTTIEIMEKANLINKYLNLTEAVAVVRHGTPVLFDENGDLLEIVSMLKEKKYNTIAIISKDQNESKKVFNLLKDKFDVTLIDEKCQNYAGGIVCITSALSKGLEFDGVVINNVDNDHFNINNEFDLKLLYVSMTRALHELVLMCDKNYFLLN